MDESVAPQPPQPPVVGCEAVHGRTSKPPQPRRAVTPRRSSLSRPHSPPCRQFRGFEAQALSAPSHLDQRRDKVIETVCCATSSTTGWSPLVVGSRTTRRAVAPRPVSLSRPSHRPAHGSGVSRLSAQRAFAFNHRWLRSEAVAGRLETPRPANAGRDPTPVEPVETPSPRCRQFRGFRGSGAQGAFAPQPTRDGFAGSAPRAPSHLNRRGTGSRLRRPGRLRTSTAERRVRASGAQGWASSGCQCNDLGRGAHVTERAVHRGESGVVVVRRGPPRWHRRRR